MSDLIAALGQKIAERWLALIVLPGLLFTAVAGGGLLAGLDHAFDLVYVVTRLNELWRQANGYRPAGVALAIMGGLAAATLAGLIAATLAEQVVHRWWLLSGPQWWINRRRVSTEHRLASRDPKPATRYLPQRAFAVGEHFRLIGERVDAQYGLSVVDVWPRLWILAGPDTRVLIGAAYRRYFADATLAAWGLLYFVVAWYWWPSAVIAVAAVVIGHRRAKTSSGTLATLIEAIIDIKQHELASALGVELAEGRVTRLEGNQINNILIKRG